MVFEDGVGQEVLSSMCICSRLALYFTNKCYFLQYSAFSLSNTKLEVENFIHFSYLLSVPSCCQPFKNESIVTKKDVIKIGFLITFITSSLKKSLTCCWCWNHCFTLVSRYGVTL